MLYCTGQYPDAWQLHPGGGNVPWDVPYFSCCNTIKFWNYGFSVKSGINVNDTITNGIPGTNWHKMSNNGQNGSWLTVDNWSLGCMGIPEPDWEKVIKLATTAPWKNKIRYTGTILNFDDLRTSNVT